MTPFQFLRDFKQIIKLINDGDLVELNKMFQLGVSIDIRQTYKFFNTEESTFRLQIYETGEFLTSIWITNKMFIFMNEHTKTAIFIDDECSSLEDYLISKNINLDQDPFKWTEDEWFLFRLAL